MKLNENILFGFCPSTGWYPRNQDEHDWYKRQWAAQGPSLYLLMRLHV